VSFFEQGTSRFDMGSDAARLFVPVQAGAPKYNGICN
jgi:hypothetical protein